MNEVSQHTPGPWVNTEKLAIRDTCHNLLCDIYPAFWTDPDDSLSVGHANARLIAAAPELLEACRSAHDAMLALKESGEFYSLETLQKCEQAIAKATTGGQL